MAPRPRVERAGPPGLRRRLTTAVLLTTLAVAAAAVGAGSPAVAENPAFIPGSGKADARVVRAGPSAGGMALAPSAALALADYLGTKGRGEARPFDWSALDGTIHDCYPELNDAFPPLHVESTDEGAAAGQQAASWPFAKEAQATSGPFGRSVSWLEAYDVPGALRVAEGRAEAFAGVVPAAGDPTAKVRVAGGTVDIGRVELGGGVVVLNGLHWEATQRTDTNDDTTPEQSGRFVLGSASLAGQVVEGPISGDALQPVVDLVNVVLATAGTGLALVWPRLEDLSGAVRMTPLGIRVVGSAVGNQVLPPVLSGAQPVREGLVDGYTQARGEGEPCSSPYTPILVGDLSLGVVAGGGQLDVELGGVFGFTEGQQFANPLLGSWAPSPATASGAPSWDEVLVVDGRPRGSAPTPVVVLADTAGTAGSGPSFTRPASFSTTRLAVGRSPASAAWAVALFGLAGALAVALGRLRQGRARRRHLALWSNGA